MEKELEHPKANETVNVIIRMRHEDAGRSVTVELPIPEEEIARTIADNGGEDNLWRCIDCPAAALVAPITETGSLRQANAAAMMLKDITEKRLTLFKALLEAKGFPPLREAMNLYSRLDEYGLDPHIHCVEDAAKWELRFLMDEAEAEKLIPHVNLITYGQVVMRDYHMTLTGYGGLSPLAGKPAFQEAEEASEANRQGTGAKR